jgi:hypothetical protein
MKTRITVALIAALFANVAAAGEGYWNNIDNGFDKMVYAQKDQAQYWAGVGASFDNMLNHTPYYGPTEVTVARGVKDPVEIALQAPGTSGSTSERDTYFANVDASFERNMNHTPYYGPTEVTVARQQDHRVDRLIHALRNEKPAATELVAAEGDDAKGGSL